jgi:hypothetical protein
MSDTLIEKVVATDTIQGANPVGTGGLTYAQANRFIDYMWDATVLGSLVTTRRMRAVEEEIDTIAVGSRLVRGATEAVDTGENVRPTFGKLSITTKKYRLDYELSSESLEDNIEGEQLEDHIARLMATQMGNDLEDIAINGDTDSTEPGIGVDDGWRKRAVEGGAHVLDHGGDILDRSAFNKALKAMPRKYMAKRGGLKFFVGTNAIQDYIFSLQQTQEGFVTPESLAAAGISQAVRTSGPAGFITGNAFGVPVQEVPLFLEDRDGDYDTDSGTSGVQVPSTNVNHTDLWLTFPENLIWGIKRDVTVYREFKPKKDTVEYTVYTRQGVQIENLDAFVVLRNVRISE